MKQFTLHHDCCLMKVGTDGILLGAWADGQGAKRVLDIGTGCGLVALMLAQRYPQVQVNAVELDEASATQAAENVAGSPFAGRVVVVQDAIQAFAKRVGERYELMVSNPPFFKAGVARDMARHTSTLSHADLLDCVENLLAESGKFCVILPVKEGEEFIELALEYGLFLCKRMAVWAKSSKSVERLLLAFGFVDEVEVVEEELVVYEESGGYTAAYVGLTGDFYLGH